MRLIQKRVIKRGVLVGNVEQALPDAWRVKLLNSLGVELEQVFDHDPSDDELQALDTKPARIKPTALADRIDAIAEVAHQYLIARQLTELADFATLFTAQERTRIATGRDTLLAELKALI